MTTGIVSEIWHDLKHPSEEPLMSFVALLMVVCVVMLGALLVAGIHDWRFEATHTCLRTNKYWEEGHFVGIPGKGGYWQPAGWHYYCLEWSPHDGLKPWLE